MDRYILYWRECTNDDTPSTTSWKFDNFTGESIKLRSSMTRGENSQCVETNTWHSKLEYPSAFVDTTTDQQNILKHENKHVHKT
jgi:hypothetical protein